MIKNLFRSFRKVLRLQKKTGQHGQVGNRRIRFPIRCPKNRIILPMPLLAPVVDIKEFVKIDPVLPQLSVK